MLGRLGGPADWQCGASLRRSFDRVSGKSPLQMVSAWGCEQRLMRAQIATDAKWNEITAVPKLLEMLRLKGTIVTAAALNCQCTIAQQIIEQATRGGAVEDCGQREVVGPVGVDRARVQVHPSRPARIAVSAVWSSACLLNRQCHR
jgi:hypothetical protein